MVLVDTPIWSYALRSKKPEFEQHSAHLQTLIQLQQVVIIGPIRQEILSGYSDLAKFSLVRDKLSGFENTPITASDYVQAAECFNRCRQNGVQGSHIDFLICAVSLRLCVEIYTTDKDFENYQKYLPIKLYNVVVN